MLKKTLTIGTTALIVGLTSCKGEFPSSLCDCMEVQAEIIEKSMHLPADDEEGFKKIQDQFKTEIETCEDMSDAFNTRHEDLSVEKKRAIQVKQLEGCDAVLQIEELLQERMDKAN